MDAWSLTKISKSPLDDLDGLDCNDLLFALCQHEMLNYVVVDGNIQVNVDFINLSVSHRKA